MALGDYVADLKGVKDEIKLLQGDLKALEAHKRFIEVEIMDEMDTIGSSLSRTDAGTVSITTETVAQVVDWAAVEAYTIENNALYLFQRRLSNPAWRDECESKGLMPGTAVFTKRKIGFSNKTS